MQYRTKSSRRECPGSQLRSFGLAASSALVIGATIGARWDLPKKVTGALLAFASGTLISALAFELFEEAFHLGGPLQSGLGLLAGAAALVIVDSLLDPIRQVVAEGPAAASDWRCWPR